jgi:UV excision repair protein RAD23
MAALAQNPQALMQMLQQMPPEVLQQMAGAMAGGQGGQPNPQALMAMLQNPQMMQMMMQMMAQGGGGGGMGGPGGAGGVQIQVTEAEAAAIDQLVGMGFDRNHALQAFIACDRNAVLF